jgi:protease-4
VAEIEPLAAGRVWSGFHAAEQGLVDKLGGFDVAIAELKQRIGAGAEHLEPVVISPPRVRPPPALLPRLLFGLSRAAPLGELAALLDGGSREPAWAWCEITLAERGD